MIRRPPRSTRTDTLFPYTTLFRSKLADKKDRLNTVGEGIVELYQGNESAATAKFAAATEKLRRRDYLELYHIGRAYIDAPEPNYQKAVEYLDQAKAKNAEDPMIPLAWGDANFGLESASPAYVNYRENGRGSCRK